MRRLAFILCSLLPSLAWAQTPITAYVKLGCANNGDGTTSACAGAPAGAGAYNTLDGAITSETADLVSANEVLTITCDPNGNNPDVWPSAASLGGYTTDATRFVIVRSTDPENKCVVEGESTYTGILRPASFKQKIFDIDFIQTHAGTDYAYGLDIGSTTTAYIEVAGSSFHYAPAGGTPTTGRCYGVFFYVDDSVSHTVNVYFYNNMISGWDGCATDFAQGLRLQSSSSTAPNYYFYNNTIVGNALGSYIALYHSITVKLRNNLIADNTSDYYKEGSSGTFVTQNNMTSDATSPDDGIYDSATNTFVDAANGDLSIESGSDAIGEGADLSADGDLAFSIDYFGVTRSDWDIGAHEFQASAPTARPANMFNRNLNKGFNRGLN